MDLDLSLDYPVVSTTSFEVAEADPVHIPVTGGLVVDVGVWDVPSGSLGFTVGARGWGASWDRVPDFGAQVWNADLDLTYRLLGPDDKLVQAWWGVGGGLRAGVLAVDWWDDVASFGFGGWTGGGLVIGRGDVRGQLSARAGLSVAAERWTGTIAAADATTTWTYWPGSARVGLLAGVAFR